MLTHQLERYVLQGPRCTLSAYVGVCKKFATQAELKLKEPETAEVELENARPYAEVPGPSKYQLVRGVLPGGVYYKKDVYELINAFNREFGPLFRMPGMFGKDDTLISMNPADYSVIFRNEGHWPYRRGFDSTIYHRQVHRRDFFEGVEGIISSSGEEWAKMRSAVNPILMQPKNAKLYLNTMLQVSDEWLERIREVRNPTTQEMPENFDEEICRFTFETIAAIAVNKQLGLIRKNRDTAEAKTILGSLRKTFELAYKLDVMPSVWKIVKTPKFHEMMETLDTLTNICNKYINEALVRIEHDPEGKITSQEGQEKSVLEKLLRIDKKVAVVMALDMMMAGVDTTCSSLAGILLCIAKNPDKQALLLQEIRKILPQKDSTLTLEKMQNLPYLRACIKEGMRIYPIIPGTMRRMPHDVVLSGYRVPKGTDVTMGANLQMRSEEFVPQANKFLPERWLRNAGDNKQLTGAIDNPFMFLPFGFGPRSCAGKRIVNLEMEIAVARLVRNFNIEFNYPVDNAFKAKFMNVPNVPLKFKFEERRD